MNNVREDEVVHDHCGLWATLHTHKTTGYSYIMGAAPKVKINATGYVTVDLDRTSLVAIYHWVKAREKEVLNDSGTTPPPSNLPAIRETEVEPEVISSGD